MGRETKRNVTDVFGNIIVVCWYSQFSPWWLTTRSTGAIEANSPPLLQNVLQLSTSTQSPDVLATCYLPLLWRGLEVRLHSTIPPPTLYWSAWPQRSLVVRLGPRVSSVTVVALVFVVLATILAPITIWLFSIRSRQPRLCASATPKIHVQVEVKKSQDATSASSAAPPSRFSILPSPVVATRPPSNPNIWPRTLMEKLQRL